jgi:uncharacterized protein HemX
MPPQNQIPQNSGGWGATMGIAIIVLLLAAGGAYFFYIQSQGQQKRAQDAAAAQAQASSTEENLIQNDLNATATTSSSADLDSLQGSL